MIDLTLLTDTCQAWGLALSDRQLGQFAAFAALLGEWSEHTNLVAASTLPDLTRRHLLDSLALATAWEAPGPPGSMADIGAGGGFPGLPLAILWPATQVTLIESIGKKAAFLRQAAERLGLERVAVVSRRAEEVGRLPAHRERYQLVTARAVTRLAPLAEYCLPLCALGGLWFAPKGADVDAELAEARPAIRILGGAIREAFDVQVPGAPARSLIVVAKASPTPAAYPRAIGVPSRQPLGA